MVAILEAAARYIGLTIDNTMEALVFITTLGRAQQYVCQLSEYAAAVFRLSQNACPFL